VADRLHLVVELPEGTAPLARDAFAPGEKPSLPVEIAMDFERHLIARAESPEAMLVRLDVEPLPDHR
jgi:hypothetical protein